MNVLVFNVGSTTLKYACLEPDSGTVIRSGLVDRIGQPGGDAPNHVDAAKLAINDAGAYGYDAIGHRIVQGGAEFLGPALVTPTVLARLELLDSLAPLHNPPARSVVQGLVDCGVPQTLVFDTAYFATLSPAAYRYAVPEDWYRNHGVRRYGFHGTSHCYVTQQAMDFVDGNEQTKMISLHLGGGASVTASVGGLAIDTSMGMTPLEGLVMASRSGDIDPAIALHLIRVAGLTANQVDDALNKKSGLLGLCGESDMRAILDRCNAGEEAAELAIEIYIRKIIKTIGSYYAIMGGLDVLVFTAGIGEHAAAIRERIATPLEHLGIKIDQAFNDSSLSGLTELSSSDAAVRTLVIPTNEELAIARQVML